MTSVLQNIVFPANMDSDVLPLYVDADIWTQVGYHPVRLTSIPGIDDVISRFSSRIRSGKRVSFATYFNAFPASYWQRWTVVENLTLNLNLTGHGTVTVYRSNQAGQQQRVATQLVSGENIELNFSLKLDKFGDGGWYWFDLSAGTEDLILNSGAWITPDTPVNTGKLSLGMCTYNKADYCVKTLQAVASEVGLLSEIDQILLVDQGTIKVQDEAEFPAIAKDLGAKLRVINQGNLGGSGGFSRAMYETLKLDNTDYLLLLDDDIEFEPESALRALQFGRFSRNPTIVGGHMFDLLDKPVIHAWAEQIDPLPFLWGPSFPEQHRHDFRQSNLRQTPWMHARLDSDYNGWWMCLIPKKIIADIGLSLPLFIKWDDAEYGLRAKAAGYRTVSLPGVCLWHMSWLDKDDSQDWQAYFHTRNKLIAGLLHSTQRKSGRLIQNSYRQDVKKLLNMQYYAAQLSVNAWRDVLAGPENLIETVLEVMPNARALAKDFPETKVYKPSDPAQPRTASNRELPSIKLLSDTNPENDSRALEYPKGIKLALFTLKNGTLHWFRSSAKELAPESEFGKQDAMWWRIPKYKSVLVGAADGSGKMLYQHDQEKFRKLLKQAYMLAKNVERNWDSLSARYKAAARELSSVESWEKIFKANQDS
ncbi:MAG: glycosyltransferase [Arcanobacterium sp.]|nr:glycosyltransferase [Arcanobacterium sp.]